MEKVPAADSCPGLLTHVLENVLGDRIPAVAGWDHLGGGESEIPVGHVVDRLTLPPPDVAGWRKGCDQVDGIPIADHMVVDGFAIVVELRAEDVLQTTTLHAIGEPSTGVFVDGSIIGAVNPFRVAGERGEGVKIRIAHNVIEAPNLGTVDRPPHVVRVGIRGSPIVVGIPQDPIGFFHRIPAKIESRLPAEDRASGVLNGEKNTFRRSFDPGAKCTFLGGVSFKDFA